MKYPQTTGNYILCFQYLDHLCPEGEGKSLEYARSLKEFYEQKGRHGFRIYKLVEVEE